MIAAGLVLALLCGAYAARNFAINSDVSALLSPNLEWRKRELAFEKAFGRFEMIVVVVTAPTPELTGEATAALADKLSQNKERFRAVTQVGGGEFFARNGLLFQNAGGAQEESRRPEQGRADDPRSRHGSEPARSHQRNRQRAARRCAPSI